MGGSSRTRLLPRAATVDRASRAGDEAATRGNGIDRPPGDRSDCAPQEPLKQADLAREIDVHVNTAVALADWLEQKQFARRVIKKDRRERVLELTSKGREKADEACWRAKRAYFYLLRSLDNETRRSMWRALSRIAECSDGESQPLTKR